jgi:tetratricopeptide (TPR) repeat protein
MTPLPTPIREAHTMKLTQPDTPILPSAYAGDTPTGLEESHNESTQLISADLANAQMTPVAPFPNQIETALGFARQKAETAEAQGAYASALQILNSPEWQKDERFRTIAARAQLQIAMGQQDEARRNLKALVERHAGENPAELNALFDRAIERFTPGPAFRRERSKFRELTGDLEGASEDLEFAVKMDPAEGDQDALENIYRLRMAKGDDPAAQFKLVKVYLKGNRVDDAIEILQDLQHHDAYETRATKILGLCHWQKNLHFLAWQKFKQLKQNEEIRDILYRLGADMESTGQLNNALSVYEHIQSENPEYRDVAAKVKKLRYRIKMHQDEADQNKAANILTDPRFTIIEEINRGSMGIIYKAHDKTLDEIVALKVLNDYLCADPGAVERFKREARAAKKLSHPYIVRIHDMFETGSKRFISMEYIEGTDLKRMLADRTSFSEEQLVYYFLQVADALSYAHKLNIIHRDIKPANVMITKDNSVKVTDFGIAKILKGDDSTKSGTAVIGTPLYMAPEQITGEGVDARSDIYALGIMMYELVSGHPPFYLGNIEYHHIHTAPPPLPEKVSERLRNVIMKCVQKSPANRFQSVDEIFGVLQ